MNKKPWLIFAGVIIIAIAFLYLIYFELTQNTQLLWKTYSDDLISFKYPQHLVDYKEIKGSRYLCSKPNKQGLVDCISYEFKDSLFDKENIKTTGGVLPQEYLITTIFGDKEFLAYGDGDAAVFDYTYIYELPDNAGYYEISFLSNDFSGWNIDRDLKTVLSSVSFSN